MKQRWFSRESMNNQREVLWIEVDDRESAGAVLPAPRSSLVSGVDFFFIAARPDEGRSTRQARAAASAMTARGTNRRG